MGLGKSLVLTHPDRLGDTVVSLPLHRAIAAQTDLETNVGPAFQFLLELSHLRFRYSGPLYPKGARALIKEAKSLRQKNFDAVFLVRPNFRSALLARLARIPKRIGDATEGRAPLLTHRVDVPEKSNQFQRLELFGKAVGVEVPTEFGLPKVAPMIPPTIGIVPISSYSDKFIPAPALTEFCYRLIDAGHQLAFLGRKEDDVWMDPFRDIPAISWMGKFTLPEIVEPLSSLQALVASDGGLYHLAVACGVPSVGVYGPTASKYWWHDWGPHVPVLAEGGLMANVTADHLWQATQKVLAAERL